MLTEGDDVAPMTSPRSEPFLLFDLSTNVADLQEEEEKEPSKKKKR